MSSNQSCLQLDVGNSGAKWRVVHSKQIIARGTFAWGDAVSSEICLESAQSVEQILVASVASPEKDSELAALLENRWGVTPWFAKTGAETRTLNGSLHNSYADPSKMGVDRWLAMLAAREMYSGAYCVVDAGSALTIDHVSEAGQHLGGYIIPGPSLMERALLLDTDRVRFDESASYSLTPGGSTAKAVRHGIALAQVGAVELAVKQAQRTQDVVFSGGAGKVLLDLGQVAGAYCQDLVFDGLEIMARSAAA